MNKNIKQLVEDYIVFNPIVLQDNKPKSKIPRDIVNNILSTIHKDNTNILWNDLTVYTLSDIKESKPNGYPIGLNIIDNKFVSLKYMSEATPSDGDLKPSFIKLKNRDDNGYLYNDIWIHDDLFTGDFSKKKVEIKNNYYKPLTDNDLTNEFNDCFNGYKQTKLILNDVNKEGDYPAIDCVTEFNPGETNPGDWYLPEIGELAQIYSLKSVINYICQELINLGYTDIYPEIKDNLYWSSTFYSYASAYRISMDYGYIHSRNNDNGLCVLAMFELPTS